MNNNIPSLSNIADLLEILVIIFPIFLTIIKYFVNRKNKIVFRPECITEEEVNKYTNIYIQTRLIHNDKEIRCHKFINNLLKSSKQYHLILGDTGTGKSSFLLNNYFYFLLKIFKRGYSIYYFALRDPYVLNNILKIENKKTAILLLDAFDESMLATQDAQTMINKIEKTTKEFAKIVITSRAHFFNNETDEPSVVSNLKAIDLEESKYQKYLILPFTNKDILIYLFKKYKLNLLKQYKAFIIIQKCTDLISRPLILSYIDFLLGYSKNIKYSYEVYMLIIDRVINRDIQFIIKATHSKIKKEKLYEEYYEFLNQVAIKMYNNILDFGEPIIDFDTLNSYNIDVFSDYKKKNRTLLERKNNNFFSFSHRSIFEYFIAINIVKIQNFRFDKNLYQTYRFLAELYEAGDKNILKFIKESPKEWCKNMELFNIELAKVTYDLVPKDKMNFEFINYDRKFICEQLCKIIETVLIMQNSLCKIGKVYAVNQISVININLQKDISKENIISLLNKILLQGNNLKVVINQLKKSSYTNIEILGRYEEVYKV